MQSQPSRRILVVDDNRDSTETMSMLLTAKGHDARVASDGATALAMAEDFQPELIILDLSLPDMDGYEIARRLRQQPYGANVVLVALTGWSGREVQAKAADAGFDYHLLKPVEWPQIEQLVEALPIAT